MRTIYEPSGRAKEYSELALNLYDCCNMGCAYCYVNNIPGFKGRNHCGAQPRPRISLGALDKKALAMERAGDKREILLCFICDPYPNNPTIDITTEALKILESHRLKVQILTKSIKVERDFNMIHYNGWQLGFTLTHWLENSCKIWESRAPLYDERQRCLKAAHEYGIKTFVSLEPVIDIHQALDIIQQNLDNVDFWKIGKLNHMPEIEKKIDYQSFLQKTLKLLRGRNYYIKNDLRRL